MSAYEPDVIDVDAEVERRVKAELEKRGVKEPASDEVIQADLAAASTSDEVAEVCRRHGLTAPTL